MEVKTINKIISIQIPEEMIDKFLKKLKRSDDIVILKTKNKYEVFRGRINDKSIVIYSSGKIVVPNLDQIKQKIERILHRISPQEHEVITIGSDEAGKGEILGPLVVASVALNHKQNIFLRSQGVMDSKNLSLSRVKDLSSIIKKNSLTNGIVLISPVRFNQLFREFKDEGKSLNDLLAWAHAKAIKQAFLELKDNDRKKLDKIIVDEFSKVITEIRVNRELDRSLYNLIQQPHADIDFISVAASSILAKNERENWIITKSKQIGMKLTNKSIDEILKRKDANELGKIVYKIRK
ncbi:MAG: hypothetical protein GF329_17150 [Candidatus Lokiarchaeota archaeon]|nr:hypothetical protein [Candidatus Lokiarchaeota archaeon]